MECPVDGCDGELRRLTKEELMDPEFLAKYNLADGKKAAEPRPKYICGGKPTKHVFREDFDGEGAMVLVGETRPIVGERFSVDRNKLPNAEPGTDVG